MPRPQPALSAIVLAMATSLSLAQPSPPPPKPAGDWVAQQPIVHSAVLQVVVDRNRGSNAIDARMVAALAQSTAVSAPAVEEALGVDASRVQPYLSVAAEPANERTVTLRVAIRPGGPANPADDGRKVLDALVQRTRRAVAQASEAANAPAMQRRREAEERLAAANDRLASIAERHRSAVAANPSWNTSTYDETGDLQRQVRQYERELAGLRARLAVLEEQQAADAAAAEATPPPQNDAAIEALVRLVEARDARVRTLREGAKDGEPASPALAEAEESLLVGRVLHQLASQGVSRRPIHSDLTQLRVSVREREAQLAQVKAQLEAAPKPPADQPTAEEIQRLQNERNEAQNEVAMFRQQLREAEREETGAASVVVLDGAAAEPQVER